ncbi:hypothetical protein [Coxiella burnetii]|uniref:hypothetical protein n=1 Tax=Coxiella burnetii TaxID=777 RepID=UPI00222EF081|nr:hypothetical protein [Coxiella burnetii]
MKFHLLKVFQVPHELLLISLFHLRKLENHIAHLNNLRNIDREDLVLPCPKVAAIVDHFNKIFKSLQEVFYR